VHVSRSRRSAVGVWLDASLRTAPRARDVLCGVVVALLAVLSTNRATYDLLSRLLTPARGTASILDPRIYPTAATRGVTLGAVALASRPCCEVTVVGHWGAVDNRHPRHRFEASHPFIADRAGLAKSHSLS
jgi:hypothetical protein